MWNKQKFSDPWKRTHSMGYVSQKTWRSVDILIDGIENQVFHGETYAEHLFSAQSNHGHVFAFDESICSFCPCKHKFLWLTNKHRERPHAYDTVN